MAVYFVTGILGCGKTLCTVGKIRDYLEQGRRVATNLDINLEAFTKPDSRVSILRVPDKPSLYDLQGIGLGCEESDESKYGLLVLDELGTWFNSRNWRDKGRGEVIDWFRHARKLHWDIYFIVQHVDALDAQLVDALCEHLVICKRTDRLTMPVIGPLAKTLGIQAIFPKIHIAKVHYGQNAAAMVVDRWWYRGKDLYSAYNTDQIFDDESCGLHTVLPAYYKNNIRLIEDYKGKIKLLTPIDKSPKSAPIGLKTGAALLFTVFFMAISYRTFAKYRDFNQEIPPVVSQSQVTPSISALARVDLSTVQPVVNPIDDTDYIKKVTQGKILTVSSYYSADGRINAILHGEKDETGRTSTFTLDDARAAGYVVILHGTNVEVRRNGYYFTFVLKSDLARL